jgi:hypothetical protein
MKKFFVELVPFWFVGGMLLTMGIWHHEIITWTSVYVSFPIIKFAMWFGGGLSL